MVRMILSQLACLLFFVGSPTLLGIHAAEKEPSSLRLRNDDGGGLLLARLDLDGGNTTVQFLELEYGEILMMKTEPASGTTSDLVEKKGGDRRLNNEEESNLSPTDMYIFLSGGEDAENVPQKLLDAETRMNLIISQEENEDDFYEDDEDGLFDDPISTEDPSEEEDDDDDEHHKERPDRALCGSGGGISGFCSFVSSCFSQSKAGLAGCGGGNLKGQHRHRQRQLSERVYGPGGGNDKLGTGDCPYDYVVCMTGTERAKGYDDYAYRLVSKLEPTQGEVCHRLQRRSIRKWKTYKKASQCVREGQVGTLNRWGGHWRRRAQTYNVDPNDKYNWAVYNKG